MRISDLKNRFGMLHASCGDIFLLPNENGKNEYGNPWYRSRFRLSPSRYLDKNHRDFSNEDIKKLGDTFEAFQNGTLEPVKGFCAIADTEEIARQDFILTPGRYVGIEEQEDDGEPFDDKMKRLTSELTGLFAKSHELEAEIRKNLGAIGYEM